MASGGGVAVEEVCAAPNHCELGEEIQLLVKFTATEALADVHWQVVYECDVVELRQRVTLAERRVDSYPPGPAELRLKCKVPLSELPANNIANVSLLLVTLTAAGGSQLAKVSLPVQVVEDGDRYVRTILAPSL
eukprot:jgi/Tetstr1/459364/TSEL_000432.t1